MKKDKMLGSSSLLYVCMLSPEKTLMFFVAVWKEVKKSDCRSHLPGISTSGMTDEVIQSNYHKEDS